jgi:hypothetical protein
MYVSKGRVENNCVFRIVLCASRESKVEEGKLNVYVGVINISKAAKRKGIIQPEVQFFIVFIFFLPKYCSNGSCY